MHYNKLRFCSENLIRTSFRRPVFYTARIIPTLSEMLRNPCRNRSRPAAMNDDRISRLSAETPPR